MATQFLNPEAPSKSSLSAGYLVSHLTAARILAEDLPESGNTWEALTRRTVFALGRHLTVGRHWRGQSGGRVAGTGTRKRGNDAHQAKGF